VPVARTRSGSRLSRVAVLSATLVALLSGAAQAHEERPTQFPDGSGTVPRYRTTGPYLVVCKADTPSRIKGFPAALKRANQRLFAECMDHGFRHIQDAVDAVKKKGTRILIQPGRYLEQPSMKAPTGICAEIADQFPLSYEEQVECPHLQNFVAIFGDSVDDPDIRCDLAVCNLQLQGTGARPEDVVVDGRYGKLNVIRADRAGGVYFRNFTVQGADFNALYVIETDGFVIDRMLGRWNHEYAFLTFASDHGLYRWCEAHGNGDGGLYPGSAADHHGARPSVVIHHCNSHHNTIGVSGTAGNSLLVHHNWLHHNSVGVTLDSFFPDHAGLPQDASTFRQNWIYSNNSDYYRYYADGTCSKPIEDRGYQDGVVCPSVPVPVGTGIMLAGGNDNVFEGNRIYDNWRYGTMQYWVPAPLRGENDPTLLYDTSHGNSYVGNVMGTSPGGVPKPNGTDFWWDEEGGGNCWDGNDGGADGISSDPMALLLPTCSSPSLDTPGNPAKQAFLVPCATWSREDHHPAGCDWMTRPPPPSSGQV
jgi:hypothetical protein